MDHSKSSELISAYLDGEVTPQERAEAERLLEASPDLRVELNDFARLSDLIRGLPRESAPAELAAAIRQQAERQSLLGVEAAPKRSLRRELLAAAGAAALTAAACLVTVQTLKTHNRPEAAVAHSLPAAGQLNQFHDLAETAASPRREDLAVRDSGVNDFRVVSPDESRPELFSSKMRTSAPPPPALAGQPGSASLAATEPVDAPASDDYDGRLSERSGPDTIRIGDVLTYFERIPDGVAVVECIVVDVEEAAGHMEVLFRQNNLQVIQDPQDELRLTDRNAGDKDASGKDTDEKDSERKAPAGASENLVLMYVDAPRDKLAAVWEEMVRDHLFSQAKLQPPVDAPLAALGVVADEGAKNLEQEVAAKEVEVLNEAAEVGRNYAYQQLAQNSGLAEAKNALGGAVLKEDSARMRRGAPAPTLARSMIRGQARPERSRTPAEEDTPPSADAPAKPATELSTASRRQNSVGVRLYYDAANGQVTNGLLEQQRSAPTANAKQKPGAAPQPEERAADTSVVNKTADPQDEMDAPAENTVRLLIVLQRAAVKPTP